MTEMTPGRAACEAFWGTIRHLPGEDLGPGAAWRWAQSQNTESGWEAAAEAAVKAAPVDLTDLAEWVELLLQRDEARAGSQRLRDVLLKLAAELEGRSAQLHVIADDDYDPESVLPDRAWTGRAYAYAEVAADIRSLIATALSGEEVPSEH